MAVLQNLKIVSALMATLIIKDFLFAPRYKFGDVRMVEVLQDRDFVSKVVCFALVVSVEKDFYGYEFGGVHFTTEVHFSLASSANWVKQLVVSNSVWWKNHIFAGIN